MRFSISETLYPVTWVTLPKIHARTPAASTPRTVPMTATVAFAVKPPTRYIVTSVVKITTTIAAKMGDQRRYSAGKKNQMMLTKVNSRPMTGVQTALGRR